MEKELSIAVGDTEYLLIQNDQNFLEFNDDARKLVLVFLTKPGQSISKSALREIRTESLEKDDVFREEFYCNIVFYGSKEEDLHVEPDAMEELAAWNTKTRTFLAGDSKVNVAPGPLLTLDAPEGGLNGRVVVPSRCYFKPSKSRPLNGARISVKDNIDIEGHKTTLCNRSWQKLYPAKDKHAACVQTLVDAGAIIVGKAKLQAMIMREEPLECVEFTAPFNPRGDGYQVPSGSSHGSAAAIGSYDWLDFALGSDTNGSGRKPAHYNGCFSIRPSTGIIDTEGVIGQFPEFDMPVFFGRDISKFSEFISVWYGSSPMLRTPSQLPVKILYPLDYLPTPNPKQSSLIDQYVESLESALQVTRTNISLAELWKEQCPDGPENSDIAEYLKLAGSYPYYRDSYHKLSGFRNDYAKKYGKPPFIHRAMLHQWNISKQISVEERDMYWRRSEVYRHWLLEEVFEAENKNCITIMIFPIEVGKPNYRDAELPDYYILSEYSSLNMAPMMRAPELTAIVGEIKYDSIVTERPEPLPIGVSVIGAPGTDLFLASIVEKGMRAGGFPTTLKTGRSCY